MDDEDEFDDEFGDIDDTELLAAATQVESRILGGNLTGSSNQTEHPLDGFDSHNTSFTSFDDLDDLELPTPAPPRRISGSFRQSTLLGGPLRKENERPQNLNRTSQGTPTLNSTAAATMTKHNWRLVDSQEPPTHHRIDKGSAKTWVYPTNLGHRDYQYNIVHRALLNNLLVALPTGLGKTFIAAVVMFNWYRWAPEGQIAFLAPTKPLIAQQVDACYNICGIPKSETALLTGQVSPGQRAEYWKEKRVFYATPQTMANDLKRGYADPKRLVCIVIDEAHRATGSYSYVEVVKFVRRFNTSFRLLALTATPGSKVETVQDVIDALGIGKVEIRTEESLDIRQYIHRKNVETVTIDLSDEIVALKDAFGKCLKPILDDLRSKNACYLTDVEKLTAYTVMAAKNSWTQTPAAQNAHQGVKWQMLAKFSLLAQLAYPMQLLTCHGVRTFWSSLSSIQHESESSKNGGGKMKSAFFDHPDYKKLLTLARPLIDDDKFLGHPKMDYLNGAVLRHFVEASEDGGTAAETRVMIFSSYRDSAQEIVTMLEAHQPTIKPHIFVGQADAKANAGMPQKEQLQVLEKFQQGIYNTIVATSIGEEGLDIGEVDLIICYDSSASPIRMLQRMGRTGRKRTGNIIVLLTKGKEEESFAKAKDNYSYMQNLIASGERFNFRTDMSPRILPRDIVPEVEKQHITPPVEAPVPTSRARGRAPKKAPPKKFHMPDGVSTGFAKASKVFKVRDDQSESEAEQYNEMNDLTSVCLADSDVGLLQPSEERELQKNYMNVHGVDEDIIIAMPNLDAFPEAQRALTATKYIKHGRATRSLVKMMAAMRDINDDSEKIQRLKANLRMEDVEPEASHTVVVTQSSFENPNSIDMFRDLPESSPALSTYLRKRKVVGEDSLGVTMTDSPIDILSGDESGPSTTRAPPSPPAANFLDSLSSSPTIPSQDRESEDEDLPDVSTMFQKITNAPVRAGGTMKKGTQSRKKRRVSDSEDDEG